MLWIILVVVAFVGGIIWLSGTASHKGPSRMQFLEAVAKFVEGELRPIPGQPDAYRIEFTFEGQPFIYEDVPDRGFRNESYKGYLKAQTGRPFTLHFIEKTQSTTIKTDVIIASQIPNEPVQGAAKVFLPPKLKGLDIYTNDTAFANVLLAQERIVATFLEFKNVDARGYASIALRILDGTLILEFYSAEHKNPGHRALMRDIPSLENYLERLHFLVSYLKQKKA